MGEQQSKSQVQLKTNTRIIHLSKPADTIPPPANNQATKPSNQQKPKLGQTDLVIQEIATFPHGFDGLKLWTSSILFARYAYHNIPKFKQKYVLQLGCGTGLASISILKHCSPKNCLLSDYLPEVLKNAKNNCKINGLPDAITFKLHWADFLNFTTKYDMIIGADLQITTQTLAQAVYQLLLRFLVPNGEAYFAVTESGKPSEGISELLKIVDKQKLEHQKISLEEFNWDKIDPQSTHNLYIFKKK